MTSCDALETVEKQLMECTSQGSKEVLVHPTVLLSITDHFNRAGRGARRRVVGYLLGDITSTHVSVTNCFGVPFDEDVKDSGVWFLDRNYFEKMFFMLKKINAKEKIVGWYSTGSAIRPHDSEIHEIIRKYVLNPLYILVNFNNLKQTTALPFKAFFSFEKPAQDEKYRRYFQSVVATIISFEAEEVGIEHLLRDLQTAESSLLSVQVQNKIDALNFLSEKFNQVATYLREVAEGTKPVNPNVLTHLQRVFNCLPNPVDEQQLSEKIQISVNDAELTAYMSYLVRLVTSLHTLINTK